ncbi:hypothetical protein [Marinimicrobium locisalis]|uniref:hypothetical protein n=1 Tax=Marinimicrobium locisalis TaxID=546022 RepID=UPI003221661B
MPLPMLRQLTLASLVALGLTACGGSDSGPRPTPNSSSAGQSSSASVDEKPAQFSFEAQSDVERGATVTSNTITVSDINTDTAISVSGGAYAVNGGGYTKAAGSVEDGDKVTVQLTAPESFDTEASAALTIGGVSDTFTVTTEAEDTAPDAFGFAPQDGLEPETEVVSEPVTISGINVPVDVTIDGGEYRIDEGEFTTGSSELTTGSAVTLRAVTPAEPGQTQEVKLTIGTEQTTWAVTTAPDEEPPVGDIAFPPPMSATGAETLTIRGRASDEHSDVAEVTLTVENDGVINSHTLKADEETGFAEWQQSITLAPGENRVTLQVTDEAGNELEEPVEVTVVGQDYTDPFPNDEEGQFNIYDLIFDKDHNRLLLLGYDADTEAAEGRIALSVDLATGQRSVLATNKGENEPLGIALLDIGSLDPENNRLVATDSIMDTLFEFDLETGVGSVLMDGDAGNEATIFDRPDDIVRSPTDTDSYYIAAPPALREPERLLKVNVVDGKREVISGPNVGEGPEIRGAWEVVVTKDGKTAYVNVGRYLYEVNLVTGAREEIPLDYPSESIRAALGIMLAGGQDALHIFEISQGLMVREGTTGEWNVVHPYSANDPFDSRRTSGAHYVEEDGYFFVAQDPLKAVYAYDLSTNEFVIITRYSE